MKLSYSKQTDSCKICPRKWRGNSKYKALVFLSHRSLRGLKIKWWETAWQLKKTFQLTGIKENSLQWQSVPWKNPSKRRVTTPTHNLIFNQFFFKSIPEFIITLMSFQWPLTFFYNWFHRQHHLHDILIVNWYSRTVRDSLVTSKIK